MKIKVILILIFLLAFVLRFYRLGVNPPSLYWDETINCYDAYSLGQTGKDHHGVSWPIAYLISYGDYKNPLYTYLDIFPVKLFGLNEFSCRFPSAFFGWLTVILTYFLVKELFKTPTFVPVYTGTTAGKQKSIPLRPVPYGTGASEGQAEFIALISSLLLAVSPWHLQFSRAGFEANVNLFFIVLGIFLFLKAVNRKIFFLPLSAISFGLTPYAYHSSKLFMPLLVISLSVIYVKFIFKNLKWALISLVLGLFMLYPLTTKEARKAVLYRFTETNIFNEEDVVLESNKLREEDNWSFLSNILHNRRIYYAQKFLVHYFDHFNFGYLFLTGDSNIRHSTQAVGEFYLVEFPFLVLGFYYFLRNKEKALLMPISWLFLSIVPASFTIATPHAIRTLAGLGSWQIIIAYGFVNLVNNIRKENNRLFLITFYLLLTTSIFYYLHYYYLHYPKESSSDWQYGYKEAVTFIKDNYEKYNKIIISDKYGRAYGYLLFYLKYPPEKIQKEVTELQNESKGYGISKFDKFEIGNINWSQNKNQKDTLLIGGAEEFPTNVKSLKTIKNLNGEEVFLIVGI